MQCLNKSSTTFTSCRTHDPKLWPIGRQTPSSSRLHAHESLVPHKSASGFNDGTLFRNAAQLSRRIQCSGTVQPQVSVLQPAKAASTNLLYDGIVFDMVSALGRAAIFLLLFDCLLIVAVAELPDMLCKLRGRAPSVAVPWPQWAAAPATSHSCADSRKISPSSYHNFSLRQGVSFCGQHG